MIKRKIKPLLAVLAGVILLSGTGLSCRNIPVAGTKPTVHQTARAAQSTAARPASFQPADRRVPVYAVDTKEKVVAISIDSCWGADQTRHLLQILSRRQIKVTFFLTGIWAKKYPELVKEIANQGNEIGNHSDTHPDCTKLTASQIKSQLNTTDSLIYRLTGRRTRLFRPPYGSYNRTLVDTAHSLDYELIQWTVDSLDWKGLGVKPEEERVLAKVKPGAIILFHNSAKYTPEALPYILDQLKKRGYRVVPVSELLIKDNYYIDHTGLQKKKPIK